MVPLQTLLPLTQNSTMNEVVTSTLLTFTTGAVRLTIVPFGPTGGFALTKVTSTSGPMQNW
ncbi:Uncharacterised protein [uncultured archaeon]|nr:Uncharacterised protein [uncultured archaeon]